MATLTLTNALVAIRDDCQDNDSNTANYVFADAIYTRELNRNLALWRYGTDKRIGLLKADNGGLQLSGSTTMPQWIAFGNGTPPVLKPLQLYFVAVATPTTNPLLPGIGVTAATRMATAFPIERVKPWELEALWRDYSTATGAPTQWAAFRENSGAITGTGAGTQAGQWFAGFHPKPDAAYDIAVRAEVDIILLSSGTDVIDASVAESYGLCALTAAWGALRAGREELVDRILAKVPPTMQALAEQMRAQNRPARKEGEEAA